MYEDHDVVVKRTVCTCDRCGREMDSGAIDGEWEERVSISFRCGYFSEFGDGNLVEGDFCQHCVKELLGTWLRVTEDDPFDVQAKPAYEATRAYQEYQLREMSRGRWSLRQLFGLETADECVKVRSEERAGNLHGSGKVDLADCRRAFENQYSPRPDPAQWPRYAAWWDDQFELWRRAWQACGENLAACAD